jgi:hypothetical protein
MQTSSDPADVPNQTPFDIVPTEDGEVLTWREERTLPASVDYARPEWSAHIWGRTRAALLLPREVHQGHGPLYTGALTLPY